MSTKIFYQTRGIKPSVDYSWVELEEKLLNLKQYLEATEKEYISRGYNIDDPDIKNLQQYWHGIKSGLPSFYGSSSFTEIEIDLSAINEQTDAVHDTVQDGGDVNILDGIDRLVINDGQGEQIIVEHKKDIAFHLFSQLMIHDTSFYVAYNRDSCDIEQDCESGDCHFLLPRFFHLAEVGMHKFLDGVDQCLIVNEHKNQKPM